MTTADKHKSALFNKLPKSCYTDDHLIKTCYIFISFASSNMHKFWRQSEHCNYLCLVSIKLRADNRQRQKETRRPLEFKKVYFMVHGSFDKNIGLICKCSLFVLF